MKAYLRAGEPELVYSGSDYFDRLVALINGAQHTLHLQTYIFESDETGWHTIEALKQAASRQVKVYVLVDAFGSQGFHKAARMALHGGGVHFRFFAPLFSGESVSFGRRLHHKLVVADGQRALIGGINIANKYNAQLQEAPWFDYAMAIEGDTCKSLDALCLGLYKRRLRLPAQKESNAPVVAQPNETGIRIRRNDWLKGKNEVHRSYAEALISAEHSIVLVASYFLPGRTFRKLLRGAAQRGVEVRIIVAGKSDLRMMRLAENYLYDFYFENNIRIYEWSDSVMHGKAMCVDNTWSTIGSYNLNPLSHYLSIELNIDVLSKSFAGVFMKHLNYIMDHKCRSVHREHELAERTVWKRIKMRLGYVFYKMLLSLMLKRKNTQERHNGLHVTNHDY
jgi:cardiolipin synthase